MSKLSKALRWRGIPLHPVCEQHKAQSFDFTRAGAPECDLDEPIVLHEKATWANVAHAVGAFPSVGEARRAGWNQPLEPGYTEGVLIGPWGEPIFFFASF
jgi:hypothetical protein